MEIKHILVPVDFSPCSANALGIAAKMAKDLNGKLFVLHANTVPDAYMTIAGTYTPIDMDPIHDEVEKSFAALRERIPLLNEVEMKTISLDQNLVDGLFTEIQANQIDLVVMGTRDHHDKLEKMLGTHASEVVKAVNIPVLVIPENITDFQPKAIGFATDSRSITNAGRLSYLTQIAENYQSRIDVFFIGKPDESVDFHNSSSGKVLDRYFQSLTYEFHNVKDEDVMRGIKNYAKEKQINLLVMVPRHHNSFYQLLHGSHTKQMAQNLSIPMLTLPE